MEKSFYWISGTVGYTLDGIGQGRCFDAFVFCIFISCENLHGSGCEVGEMHIYAVVKR